MQVRTIEFSRRINLGNYEHAELKLIAEVTEPLDQIAPNVDYLQQMVDYHLQQYQVRNANQSHIR